MLAVNLEQLFHLILTLFPSMIFENNTLEMKGIKKLTNGIVYKNAIKQPKKYNSVLLVE